MKSCAESNRRNRGLTLIELLVVLVIIASVAGAVTFAIANSLHSQEAKECQTSMLMIESAKDEYARDHPGETQIEQSEFVKYFPKYGMPQCPLHQTYQNLDQLNGKVSCPVHGEVKTD
jgi:prepilin-type N-terminal cleavage/methylation domain-containing protein